MSPLVHWMDRTLYPNHQNHWDDEQFREVLLDAIAPDSTILDLGAGSGNVPQMNFRGLAARVCGIDPDERVSANPLLDEGRIGYGEAIPYADELFDVVFADNVLEHLSVPHEVFSEGARVRRPGGRFFAKTPNLFHYVPTLARLTPPAFHQWVNERRGRKSADTFPTCYRANTSRDIRQLAKEVGLIVEQIMLVEGRPEYLRLSPTTYFGGWLYERAVNLIPGLANLRVILIAELRKPTALESYQSIHRRQAA